MEGSQGIPTATEQPGLQRGLIRIASNNQIDAMEWQSLTQSEQRPQEVTSSLAAHIRTAWEAHKRAKQPVEERMLRSKRNIEGEYDPAKLAALKSVNSSEVFMMVTREKVRDAKAWLRDILQPAGDKPWSVDPTPEPEISPMVAEKIRAGVLNTVFQAASTYSRSTGQPVSSGEFNAVAQSYNDEILKQTKKQAKEEAAQAAGKMSSKIEDQLAEGGWNKAFRDVIDDLVKYPAGIMKNPVIRKQKVLKYVREEATGRWVPDVRETLVVNFERVSPWNAYPAPGAKDINGSDFIERVITNRSELNSLLGVPGYKDEEVRKALVAYGRGGLKEWLWTDSERNYLDKKGTDFLCSSNDIEALCYWGSVQGSVLLEWGMSAEEIPDPDLDYKIEAWLIGIYVVKAVINPDKLGRKPYGKASWEEETDAFWGRGLPESIYDVQDICNQVARAIVNNIAIASGPQVEVDIERMAAGSNYTDFWPWKIWTSTNKMMATGPAVRFYQPQLLTTQLMEVYDKYKQEADDKSGVPSYGHGNPDVGGAGNTAAGLSMLMSSYSKVIKDVVNNIDTGIIEPSIGGMYDFNMLYDDDESIKGDVRVKARGSSSLIAKEQLMMRRKELLRETNNPVDLAIIGMRGRRELLKETIKAAEMPVDKIIPGDDEMAAMEAEKAQGTQTKPGEGKEKSETLGPDGRPAGGKDTALFNGQVA